MSDIVKFIKDRLTEDEEAARAAGERALEWRSDGAGVAGGPFDPRPDWIDTDDQWSVWDSAKHTIVYDEGWPEKAEALHIARHDPERVLRQCAMIRAMLRRADEAGGLDLIVEGDRGVGPRTWPYIDDLMHRDIAAIWSDHPDYDQDWALVDAEEES